MKHILVTPEIRDRIVRATKDEAINTGDLMVYEAILADTKPLRKFGTIFEGARISAQTLRDMEDFLAAEGTIPLQISHDQEMLPVGRVFHARAETREDGDVHLRGMFFIHRREETLISDIENSIIDSVSVGLLNKHIFCSECGFDYRDPEQASVLHLIDRTCDKGHTIGSNGVHARLSGVEHWFELSLVSGGAARTNEILSRARARFGKDERVERMAASGFPIEATVLTASFHQEVETLPKQTKEGVKTMDMSELVASLTESKADVKVLQSEKALLEKQIADLEAAIASKDEEIEQLKAAAAEEDENSVAEELEQAKAELDAAKEVIAENYEAAMTAAGEEAKENLSVAEMSAAIKETGLKLHQIFGRKAKDTVEAGNDTLIASVNAFKVRS